MLPGSGVVSLASERISGAENGVSRCGPVERDELLLEDGVKMRRSEVESEDVCRVIMLSDTGESSSRMIY